MPGLIATTIGLIICGLITFLMTRVRKEEKTPEQVLMDSLVKRYDLCIEQSIEWQEVGITSYADHEMRCAVDILNQIRDLRKQIGEE